MTSREQAEEEGFTIRVQKMTRFINRCKAARSKIAVPINSGRVLKFDLGTLVMDNQKMAPQ